MKTGRCERKEENTCVRRGRDEKGNQMEGTKTTNLVENVRAVCAPEVATGSNQP